MLHPIVPLLALLVAAPAMAGDVRAAPGGGGGLPVDAAEQQLSIHEHIVIRLPRQIGPPRRHHRDADDRPIRWVEKHGPRCVAYDTIEGATIDQPGSVDLLLDDGSRMRADLDEDCPALDFYSGFYMKPSADGMACAGRDPIQSRSGAVCPIHAFRRLVAKH